MLCLLDPTEKRLFIDSIITMFKFYCLLFLSIFCYSQNEFKIIQSNTLENRTINGEKFEIFAGEIIVTHKKHTLYCDTMLISQKNNFIKAWGKDKILIKDTSDLEIQSKTILFFKNDSIINFKDNVVCIKEGKKIYTNKLIYNSKEKIAYYENGGEIHDKEIIINSKKCKYQIETENANFYEDVKLKGEDYIIFSNNINLNTKKELITFNERSEIIKDSLNIKGDYGIYQKKTDCLDLFGNVIVEKNDKINIISNTLISENNISTFTDKPKIIIKSDESDFTIKGDEIIINNKDSILSIFNNVYIYSDSIKGECETSFYDLKSEKISLIKKPVLWVNKQQITGDTIFLYTKNESLDSIYIPRNSFVLSKKHEKYYNQIKGNVLSGKFFENKIEYIYITGNSTLKYFNKKSGLIDGVNDIICNKMKIYFTKSDIEKIYFNGEPDANYTPVQLINESDIYLDGFSVIER